MLSSSMMMHVFMDTCTDSPVDTFTYIILKIIENIFYPLRENSPPGGAMECELEAKVKHVIMILSEFMSKREVEDEEEEGK